MLICDLNNLPHTFYLCVGLIPDRVVQIASNKKYENWFRSHFLSRHGYFQATNMKNSLKLILGLDKTASEINEKISMFMNHASDKTKMLCSLRLILKI